MHDFKPLLFYFSPGSDRARRRRWCLQNDVHIILLISATAAAVVQTVRVYIIIYIYVIKDGTFMYKTSYIYIYNMYGAGAIPMSEKGLRLAGDIVMDLRLVGEYFFNTFR